MADTNICIFVGRLTRDPELRQLGSKGTSLLTFTIANNVGFGDYAVTNYFDCKAWGKTAEAGKKNLMKGKQVAVSGIMKTESWNDKQTGLPVSKIVLECTEIQYLSDPARGAPNPRSEVLDEGIY